VTVPPAAGPAADDDDPTAGSDQVCDDLVLLEDLRADREPQLDVRAVGPVLAAPPPRPAATALESALRAKAGEVTQVGIGDEHHVAAAAAVTAVGTAPRDEFLPAEAEPAVAAAAGPDVDTRSIVKHD
jgi:hypothetical protein